jgi:hypothetical protein
MLVNRPFSTAVENVLVNGTAVLTAGATSTKILSVVLSNNTAGAIVPTISIKTKAGVTIPVQKVASMAAGVVTTVQIPRCLNKGDSLIVAGDVTGLDVFTSAELLDG